MFTGGYLQTRQEVVFVAEQKAAYSGRPPKLLDRLREALRSRHYSRRTEQTYCQWVKRFIFFHNIRHPAEMAEAEINGFLTHLAVKEKVNEILIRDGKGAKDRITMLPETLKVPLREHLKRVKAIHDRDLAENWGRVQMPDALDRKYPNAPADGRWQWVFPQENRWKNTKTGEEGRHHVHETILQRAVKEAVRSVVIPSGMPSPHT
jgi:hypothetical protein